VSNGYKKYDGPHSCDLTPLEGKIVDLNAGGMRGLQPDKGGFAEVVSELSQASPEARAAAGIPVDVYEHFQMCNETVAIIDEKLPVLKKQCEVLTESRAFYIDARQNDICLMVDSMKSRAQRRKDETLLSPFEKTIRYRRQSADKAVRTRRQNQAARDEAEAAEPAEIDGELEQQLDAYKAELEAKFNEAVNSAVEKKLAQMNALPKVA
jgi:hypothetical protein